MFQRNRKKNKDNFVLNPGPDTTKRNVHEISNYWAILGILFVLGLSQLSRHFYLSLPEGLKVEDMPSNPNRFIAERSWNDLKLLTEMGPRVTGTYNNEVLGVDFLKREISFIQQLANKNQNVTMDHQIVSGIYFADFKPHGMTNMYQNVQNIVVKLQGKSDKSILLNCHFDSVAGSYGASDDAASCCVMLEVLRVLSKSNELNRHSIIFLFNGAEETPLQAAHGFVTEHKWAKEIKMLLNLESVGSGGKEMLFQTGPNHPWLVELYGKSVPHPNAQVAAEEVFQSGFIPSDTDFRIFRDFGKIPGLDFAHIINGYRYHTRYDHIDYLPLPVLQRTGDNVLEMTKTFSNSEIVDNTDLYAEGKNVFFDLSGLVFISYSKFTGVLLNLFFSISSIIIPYAFLNRSTRGVNSKYISSEILRSFFVSIFSIILSGFSTYLIAYSMDFSGKSMTWYTHTWMAPGLYSIPTLAINCGLHILTLKRNSPISLGLRIQARLIGVNAVFSIMTIVTVFLGLRIGYSLMIIMAIFTVTSTLVGVLQLQNTIKYWLYVHMFGQIFTVIWTSQLYHIVMMMFIPIAGRSGGFNNPDITVGAITTALTFLIVGYLVPLVLLIPGKKKFIIGLGVAFLFTRFILGNSGIDFPYRDDSTGHPTPQRLFVTHTVRNFYNQKGEIRNTDSGFWLREMDRNTAKTIESLSAPGTPIKQEDPSFCKDEVFCALPTYSCRQLHTGSYWLPSNSAPLVRKKAKFRPISSSNLGAKIRKLDFSLSNEGVTSLQVRPKPGVSLVKWSLTEKIPDENFYNDQRGYFVMITHGTEPTPFNITMEFQLPEAIMDSAPVMDISVVTTHWDSHGDYTPVFNNLIAKVPSWVFPVFSIASVEVYEF